MALKALFLNCTLKKSPETSHTQALIDKVADLMEPMDVECETVRLVDYKIAFGTESDMGDGDEWPKIYDKIKAADILVPSMPIWMGARSSLCQLMAERLDGSYRDLDPEHGAVPPLQQGRRGDRDRERGRRARLLRDHSLQLHPLRLHGPTERRTATGSGMPDRGPATSTRARAISIRIGRLAFWRAAASGWPGC